MDRKYLLVYNGSSEEVENLLGIIIYMRLEGQKIGGIADDHNETIAGYKKYKGWSLSENDIKRLIKNPVMWPEIKQFFNGKQKPISFYMYVKEKS